MLVTILGMLESRTRFLDKLHLETVPAVTDRLAKIGVIMNIRVGKGRASLRII
jgi:hypothetical protein